MATLQITITEQTEQDYDGIDETNKMVYGDIDGEILPICCTEETIVDDATCKTNYKTNLTALGYAWDTEI